MSKRELYPEIQSNNDFMMDVGGGHNIYVEESGNPEGKPVIFLHGGPGGATKPDHRRYFDPEVYRIVMFDQRGCGKSTPFANLENNTTWDLVADMERIRERLKIDKWMVFGGSWGSTLSLSYSIKHTDRVSALVVRGIFLCRPQDIGWFYQDGASKVFPDAWEGYLAPIPKQEHSDLVAAYHKRLMSDDKAVQLEAAKAWSKWEGSTIFLFPQKQVIEEFGADDYSIAFARIENHYFTNKGFFETDNWILENMKKISEAKIPGRIIHGRYDMCTPLYQGWELSKAWPEATLEIVPDSGHAGGEGGIVDALVKATDAMKEKI